MHVYRDCSQEPTLTFKFVGIMMVSPCHTVMAAWDLINHVTLATLRPQLTPSLTRLSRISSPGQTRPGHPQRGPLPGPVGPADAGAGWCQLQVSRLLHLIRIARLKFRLTRNAWVQDGLNCVETVTVRVSQAAQRLSEPDGA